MYSTCKSLRIHEIMTYREIIRNLDSENLKSILKIADVR